MNKLWKQIKRIWHYCKNITRFAVNKTMQDTGKMVQATAKTITAVLSVAMFIVFLSGVLLTATEVSFFNIPLYKEGPIQNSQQIPIKMEGYQKT